VAQLPPGGTAFDGSDPVVWAKITPGQEHNDSNRDGTRTYRHTWLVKVNGANVTAAAVRASTRLPAEGFPLYAHVPATDPTLLGTYMRADPPVVVDGDAAVVLRDVKQTADPYYFEVSVFYEGTDDPTAETPEVSSEEVAYQEFLTFDVNGKPVMNSAFDPIDGGMPSEGFFKRVTITRNLPYTAWHQKKGDKYRKTLNASDFVYSGQVGTGAPDTVGAGEPVKELFGTVLLDSIREVRLQRTKKTGGTYAERFYWRVTAELLVDLTRVRLSDGVSTLRRHRWVVPDAGFQSFTSEGAEAGKMRKAPITLKGQPASQPQLLDGRGRTLVPDSTQLNNLPAAFFPFSRTSANGGMCPDFYACEGGSGTFTVSDGQGVLANDTDPGITSVVVVDNPSSEAGTLTLNTGGGFAFTRVAGFRGWAFFTYKPTGADDSVKQTCHILVGVVPNLLFFDRYRFSNWSEISALLEGW
jgi:hypothetical protein